ncbi:MAG: 4-(cytidine 5'-diphospho)-2-C-methyl-D-erythritol kinase [Clostridiales bacterium]|nr:4-(cytidine 5'-diphospho)-2-C-methyl-D-erythritol kinase [Clostridiales bacterium]
MITKKKLCKKTIDQVASPLAFCHGQEPFYIHGWRENMDKIVLKAPAKINWTLDILGKRDDGYHYIDTIMQSIAIYDVIEIKRTRRASINVKTDNENVPDDKGNIGYRAAEIMVNNFNIDSGLYIYIHKHIPVAAGLGGGSSDGAAIMLGIKHLFDIDIDLGGIQLLGKSIGADIPFCLQGGIAQAQGIGERLINLPTINKSWLIIIKPNIDISTGNIYGLLDIENMINRPNNEKFLKALYRGDMAKASKYGGNVLEGVTSSIYPQINAIIEEVLCAGASYAQMSGSGASIFGAFESRALAEYAYDKLTDAYSQVFLTHTLNNGPII